MSNNLETFFNTFDKYDYTNFKSQVEQMVYEIIEEDKEKHFDLDMDFFTTDYAMLDDVATKKTNEEKRKYVFDFITSRLKKYRKSNAFSGVESFWNKNSGKYSKYNDKEIDTERLNNYIDYLFYKYRNCSGIRFYHKYTSYNSYNAIDKFGRIVCKWTTQFQNEDDKSKYVLECDAVNV